MIKKHRDVYNESKDVIAKFFRKKSVTEIDELIDMIDYAEIYLKKLGCEKQWSRVTDKEYAFNQIVKNRKYITNSVQGVAYESVVFAILNSPGEGRVYGKIPEVRKNIDSIVNNLIIEFVPAQTEQLDQDEVIDLLTDGANNVGNDKKILEMAKLVSLPENAKKAVEVVEEVIETSKNLEKERKSKDYILKQVRNANGLLQSVLLSDLSSLDINTVGVSEQIDAIEISIIKLKEWLRTRENQD